uniref:DBH-like monooxygenase protein 1 homolog n=1 Tax=Phallusia mammillata TaxID=59560 RepID=A0A6F9DKE1_9ASCI|nr:DBH-like monooxygenase protein 1 homolog [Phallusia mammillata]
MASIFRVLCIGLTLMLGCQGQTPSQPYGNNRQLDTAGNVYLYWDFNTTHITLEVHGQTTGWVGFGISPGGGMTGADIIVGWVKNGQVTITDRHATGNSFPPLDAEQNIDDLSGGESDGWTWIKFTRQFATCASTQDLAITDNTMKTIYAFSSNDPTGDDMVPRDYHGTNRGSRDLMFTSSASSVAPPAGESVDTFTLTTGGFEIPAQDTYYSCHLLQFPDVPSKRHIIKISPVIQKGHELYVHHIVVLQCADQLPSGTVVGSNGECQTENVPVDRRYCSRTMVGWGVGGGDIIFPADVGFPFGEPGDPKFVMLQMHYDNPHLDAGVVDDSGLMFTYTSEIRTHDAAMMKAGHLTYPLLQVIPPNASSFLTHADCSAECLEKAMDYSNITSIKIFSVLLHTHLIGRKITFRHFRDGVELPYIAKDDAYDFNFQAYRYVKPERTVLPGDSMQVLCDYDSSMRSGVTYGGLPTTREMCLAFMYYYPRLPIANCETAPARDPYLYNAMGLSAENISDIRTSVSKLTVYDSYADMYFASTGITVEQYLNNLPWNQQLAETFSEAVNRVPKVQFCSNNNFRLPGLKRIAPPLNITQPYVEEIRTCVRSQTTTVAMTTTSGQVGLTVTSQTQLFILALALYFNFHFV